MKPTLLSSSLRCLAQQRRRPKGAALLIALMLTLVLSAIGMVAIQSTISGMRNASNYRLRRQAQMASTAAVTYVSNRVGNKASAYWRELAENGRNVNSNVSSGSMLITPEMYKTDKSFENVPTGETGMFSSDGAPRSHEAQLQIADYQVIIRDPIEGPPSEGNDNNFCYKKVLFVSQTSYIGKGRTCVADADCGPEGSCVLGINGGGVCTEWGKPANAAWAATGVEGLIGPIDCK